MVRPDLGQSKTPEGSERLGGGQSGTALPGKQACLHVFPEHLLCAGPWGHTEKTVDRPMLRTAGRHTWASQSTQSLLKAVSARLQTTAQSGLRGAVTARWSKKASLEEVASGWRPAAQCWAVQGPHHCSAAWPCCPSALTPVPEGTGAGSAPSLGAARASKQRTCPGMASDAKKTSGRATRGGRSTPRSRPWRAAGTRAQVEAEGIQVGHQPGQRLRAGKDLSHVRVGGDGAVQMQVMEVSKDRAIVGILFSEQQGGFYKRRCHGPSKLRGQTLLGAMWLVGGGIGQCIRG